MIGSAASPLRVATVSLRPLSCRTTSAIAAAAAARRSQALARTYSSYQPPNAPKQDGAASDASSNAHRAFYRDFGAPVAKVFLGALVTYQVLYWGWLKLESLETKEEKTAEIASLEAQVRELVVKKKGK